MPFIKNMGQAPEHVSYYTHTPKADIFVDTNNAINYSFNVKQRTVVIREHLLNGHPKASMQKKLPTQINILKGKNKSHKNIPNGAEINFGEVWNNIEVKLISRPGNVEKLFNLKPYAKVELIKLSLTGINNLDINDKGQLTIQTELGDVAFTQPIAWQNIAGKRQPVEVSYTTNHKDYGFKLGQYDHSKELMIDPLLASTYVGGGLDDYVAGIHVNNNNEIIVAGATASTDFPTTAGVFNTTLSGSYDFIAMKFNPDMTQLLAATFFGGSSYDFASIAGFDTNDNLYFAGESRSSDFPFPTGTLANPYIPYQEVEDPNGSIFVAVLSADFTELLGATHIGSDIVDFVRDMDIAPNGDVYITGFTNSNNYPYTTNAFENSGKGIIISVFNPDLSQLNFSTRVGGGDGFAVNIDSDGSVFIAANKNGSLEYTTTMGAFRETPINSLSEQIYLAHLSQDLGTLVSATFVDFGTSNHIEFTPDNQILITARTSNGGFPVPLDAFDNTILPGGSTTLFKMDKTMTNINFATFLDMGFEDLYIEADGNILIFGATSTQDFPGGISPTDPMNSGFHGGPQDFAIARMNANLTQVSHSSYIGGSSNESVARGIVKDNNGNIIVSGITFSNDIFMTSNAYDTSNAGNGDIVLLKATSDLNFGPFVDGIFCDSFESPNGNGLCQ